MYIVSNIVEKQIVILKDTCILMFKEALFRIAKVWRQQKCPSINSWLKMYVYTMEHCSTIKKAEILPFDKTWMDLENIIRKGKYCYHLLWNLKKKMNV